MTAIHVSPVSAQELIDSCRLQAIGLLRRNLSSGGILAATPGARAEARGYTAIFARDAAVCAIGMALSTAPTLQREAATGLVTLARYQAPNGQLPKFVDIRRADADFWYLGCIDATLWWLIAIAYLDRWQPHYGLRQQHATIIEKAIAWAQCQSINASSCCSKTKRPTGRISCRARDSSSTAMRCGIWSSGCMRYPKPPRLVRAGFSGQVTAEWRWSHNRSALLRPASSDTNRPAANRSRRHRR